jgi:hypothetical protein
MNERMDGRTSTQTVEEIWNQKIQIHVNVTWFFRLSSLAGRWAARRKVHLYR